MRYAYQKPDGQILWHEQTMAEGPPPAVLELGDGIVAKRCYQAERKGGLRGEGVGAKHGWPMVCMASGVNANDAQKLRDEFKRAGVPTEVTRGGDPIYTSPEHRKRALAARGLHDRAAYY